MSLLGSFSNSSAVLYQGGGPGEAAQTTGLVSQVDLGHACLALLAARFIYLCTGVDAAVQCRQATDWPHESGLAWTCLNMLLSADLLAVFTRALLVDAGAQPTDSFASYLGNATSVPPY